MLFEVVVVSKAAISEAIEADTSSKAPEIANFILLPALLIIPVEFARTRISSTVA